MQRVAVVGSGGAGKTTFARKLGHRTGLPVVHLDQHFWLPGWVETPRDEWHGKQGRLLTGSRWIIDGNYGGSFDLRFATADTVVVLALSRWRCAARVVRRGHRVRNRILQAEGCKERRLNLSFLRWVWRYPVDSRPRLDAALGRHSDTLTVIELRTPAEVRRFLASIAAEVAHR